LKRCWAIKEVKEEGTDKIRPAQKEEKGVHIKLFILL
jgi:hypothetical protein